MKAGAGISAVTILLAFASTARAQSTTDAKISRDSATVVALARVPGGVVQSIELEREKGTIVYSFDIAVAGKSGVEEILVSALDGHVVAHEHESPKQERSEAEREKKAPVRKPPAW